MKLHLVSAVLNSILEFAKARQDFSAYNITKDLREKVGSGDVELIDVSDTDEFNGQVLPVIDHNTVRELVKELFSMNFITCYQQGYGRTADGSGYTLYKHTAPAPAADSGQNPATQSAVNPAPASVGTSNQAQPGHNTVILNPKVAPILKGKSSEMWQKAENYLATKGRATLKQIQSRLKGWSVTCSEIDLWARQQGFTVYPTYPVYKTVVTPK